MTDHAKIASILRDYLTNRIAEDEARWLRAPEGISASNKEFLAPTRMVRSHRESAKLAVFYSEAIESLFGKLQRF